MAGIFCLHLPAGGPHGRSVADRLAGGMPLFPWQKAEVVEVVPGELFMGAVATSRLDQSLPAVLCREGTVTAVIDGHLLRAREECGIAGRLAEPAYAAAAIAAYRKFGPGFAARLEGQFTLVLCDLAARRLIACNGRHGFSQFYLWESSAGRLWSSQLGPMAACGFGRPRLDEVAVATFLTYGQLFGRQSLLAGVEVLDPATTVEVDLAGGGRRSSRYWDYGDIGPLRRELPFRRQVSEVCDVARAAADRMVARPGRIIAGLSGGHDSRLVVALAARRLPDLTAWTFGADGAGDPVIAAQVCRTLGVRHLLFGIHPERVPRDAADFVATVDGSLSAEFSYFLGRAAELREQADVVLNGYAGEVILRGVLLDLKEAAILDYWRHRLLRGPEAPHPRHDANRTHRAVALFMQRKYGASSGLAGLVTPRAPSFPELALPQLEAMSATVPPCYRVEKWILENRGRRWTMMGSVSDRHFYSDGSLFYDYDFHDRCLAAPPEHRRHNRLYVGVMRALAPEVAGIACANTGLPVTAPHWRVTAAKLARKAHLPGTGAATGSSTGSDSQAWSRTIQREFYGDLVADGRTQARGFWDGAALKARFAAHQRGELAFGSELGLVATIELFSRRWIDAGA